MKTSSQKVDLSRRAFVINGALVMGFGNELRAPHGGIWVTGLVGQPLLYLVAILVGMVVTAVCVIIAKSIKRAPIVAEVPEPATARPVAV